MTLRLNQLMKMSYFIAPKIFPTKANILDVTPRDGLQNEKKILNVAQKIALINGLQDSGIKEIEIGSLVNKSKVPTMANSVELIDYLPPYNDMTYSVLVPNLRQYRLLKKDSNVKEIVLFVSASETFNQRNINASSKQAFEKFGEVVQEAKKDKLSIRGSVSCALGCPYEGEVKVEDVVDIVRRYLQLGVDRIDLADTIGVGDEAKFSSILKELNKIMDMSKITGHFHENNGKAIDLVYAGLLNGVTTFHSSLGGIGGCPFSKKISANLETEKLVYYLHSLGISTDVDEVKIKKLNTWLKDIII